MEIDELFTRRISAKYLDTHYWVRVSASGEPQLIRVDPMVNDNGDLIPQNVVLTIDEGQPQIMDRDAAEAMLNVANCEPLEKMLQWKHNVVN